MVVPKNTWQGMYLLDGGSYSLLGTTVAPGFDFSDYEDGKREELLRAYTDHETLIKRLTCADDF